MKDESGPYFVSVVADSHVGFVRAHNEDAWRLDAQGGWIVVADGMGGHAGGEIASRIGVDAVDAALRHDMVRDTVDAVVAANAAVVEASDGALQGMGATLVVACLARGLLEIAWVGDSRAYLLRAGRLQQLSHDHTRAQELVDAGVLDAASAADHPQRHVLTRSIGTAGLGREHVGTVTRPVANGDRILLCSDGLHGEIGDRAIEACLVGRRRDADAAQALIDAALAAGAHDNVTVAVATVAV